MYSILIVDDDIWVRRMLSKKIPWHILGIHRIDTAENGINAIKMIKKTPPNIVLSDIKMDGMGGIELLTEIRKKYPQIKTVLLSAYDDFSYAQAGLKYGAVDYLLKPIDEEALLETIRTIINKIKEENEIKNEINYLNEFSNQETSVLKSSLLRKLISGNQAEAKMMFHALEKKGSTLICSKYLLLFISYYNHLEPDCSEIIQPGIFLETIIESFLQEKGVVLDVETESGITFLIGINNQKDNVSIEDFFRAISAQLKYPFTLYHCSWFDNIYKSEYEFQKVIKIVDNNFYNKENTIINTALYTQHVFEDIYYTFPGEEQFINGLIVSDKAVIINTINKAFSWFLENSVEPVNLKDFCKQILHQIIDILKKHKVWDENIKQQDFFKSHIIDTFNNYFELKEWFNEMIVYSMELMQKEQRPKKRKLIEDIITYIENNYNKELSLNIISNHFKLNPAYLSRLFKNEVGKCFSQFLTENRIEKAKEFLKDPCMLVYMVGDKVGYSNEKYFYKIFKKIEGITPSQYRDRVIG